MTRFVRPISQQPEKVQQLWIPAWLDNRLEYALGYEKTSQRLKLT